MLATLGGFRRFVLYLRDRRGWTQAQLAEAVGRSQQWVSKLENGRIEASVGDTMAVLRALGASVAVRTEEPHEPHRGG